jgi:hypothetical protein
MTKKPQKGAGRDAGKGNVTIDLGETIEKKLKAAGMAGGAHKGSLSRQGYRPGGYRPGMFGGYRPWYASRFSSSGGSWALGQRLGLPEQLKTSDALTGIGLGIAGGRALVRVTPDIIKTDSRLAHEAIAFGVGLVPLLAKRNSLTMGVALPGAVFLGGAVVDWLLDQVGMGKPALRGGAGAPRQGADAAFAARQKLADIQARIRPQGQPAPRVVAVPRAS